MPSSGSDPCDRVPGPMSALRSADMPVFGDPPSRRRSLARANRAVRRSCPGSWLVSTSQSAKPG